jgi:hypothetical protein
MINYILQCEMLHRFESSFANIATYEKLEKRGVLECPHCGSMHITRAPMAPAIVKSGAVMSRDLENDNLPIMMDAADAALPTAQDVIDFIEKHTADVGNELPEVARAVHKGRPSALRKMRNKVGIRGYASGDDVRQMREEGINLYALRRQKFDA